MFSICKVLLDLNINSLAPKDSSRFNHMVTPQGLSFLSCIKVMLIHESKKKKSLKKPKKVKEITPNRKEYLGMPVRWLERFLGFFWDRNPAGDPH